MTEAYHASFRIESPNLRGTPLDGAVAILMRRELWLIAVTLGQCFPAQSLLAVLQ